MKKSIALLLVIFMLISMLTGCERAEDVAVTPTPTPSPTEKANMPLDYVGNVVTGGGGYIAEHDGMYYFADMNDGNRLCRADLEFSNIERLSDKANDSARIGIQICGDKLYYLHTVRNVSDKIPWLRTLYSYNLRSGEEKKVLSENISSFFVADGHIYFATADTNRVYSADTDGKIDELIDECGDNVIVGLQYYEGMLYYAHGECLVRRYDGGGNVRNVFTTGFLVYDGVIYSNDVGNLTSFPVSDNTVSPQHTEYGIHDAVCFTVYDGVIYYASFDNKIYSCDPAEGKIRFIGGGSAPIVLGEYIFCFDGSGRFVRLPKEPLSEEVQNSHIRSVNAESRPLSEISTFEEDPYAANFGRYKLLTFKPYLTDDGMYYYIPLPGDDGADWVLHLDNGVDEPVSTGLNNFDFWVCSIDGRKIYGIESVRESDGGAEPLWKKYPAVYENGSVRRLLDEPILGCYFAGEGIYYQQGDSIYLLDYSGESTLVTKIPPEMYYRDTECQMVVYRGKLWYCNSDYYSEFPYALWSYDFEGGFTRYSLESGLYAIEQVNNGYLYYTAKNADSTHSLYRFDCEAGQYELVVSGDITSAAVGDDTIFYTAFGDYYAELFAVNEQGCEKILAADEVSSWAESVVDVWYIDGRIFVLGAFEGSHTYCAEIDRSGNVLSLINDLE